MKEEFTASDGSDLSRAEFLAKFYAEEKPPREALDHFAGIPWTSRWMADPAYKIIPTFLRYLKPTGEDFFFSRTANTPSTIPHMISLQLRDFTTPAEEEDARRSLPIAGRRPDLAFLVQFGRAGLDGQRPAAIHEGVACAILDETMAVVVNLHRCNLAGQRGLDGSIFTANLTTHFHAPVSAPGQVVVKCWLVRRARRKWLTTAHVVDERGEVLVQADAVWVVARKTKI